MITQAGQMDRRIEFYRQDDTEDAFGQKSSSFTTTGVSVWAKVVQRSGKESEVSDQMVAVKKVDFIIRYKSELVLETYRILYDTKFYTIEAIIEDEARDSFMKLETRLSDAQ